MLTRLGGRHEDRLHALVRHKTEISSLRKQARKNNNIFITPYRNQHENVEHKKLQIPYCTRTILWSMINIMESHCFGVEASIQILSLKIFHGSPIYTYIFKIQHEEENLANQSSSVASSVIYPTVC